MEEQLQNQLIEAAISAREKAYAPYSKFKVGAALLGKSGTIYSGCNVENAAYGATICAERVAAGKAVSEGEKEFIALAVVLEADEPGSPCGICRQFLAEFGMDLQLILLNTTGKKIETTLEQYLPAAFRKTYLNNN